MRCQHSDLEPPDIILSQYHEFRYRPRRSSVTVEERWYRGAAHYEFNLAMKKKFNSLYGSGENHTDIWCKLCHVLSTTQFQITVREWPCCEFQVVYTV